MEVWAKGPVLGPKVTVQIQPKLRQTRAGLVYAYLLVDNSQVAHTRYNLLAYEIGRESLSDAIFCGASLTYSDCLFFCLVFIDKISAEMPNTTRVQSWNLALIE